MFLQVRCMYPYWGRWNGLWDTDTPVLIIIASWFEVETMEGTNSAYKIKWHLQLKGQMMLRIPRHPILLPLMALATLVWNLLISSHWHWFQHSLSTRLAMEMRQMEGERMEDVQIRALHFGSLISIQSYNHWCANSNSAGTCVVWNCNCNFEPHVRLSTHN